VLSAKLQYAEAADRITETPKTYTWASSDPSIISVVMNEDGTATYTTHGLGTAVINVTITTVEGNAHAMEIPVIVGAVQKADYVEIWNKNAHGNPWQLWNDTDDTMTIEVTLGYNEAPSEGYDREEIESISLKSEDESVFTVKNNNDGTAELTFTGPGIGVLEVQVATAYGNTYVGRYHICVDCNFVWMEQYYVNGETELNPGDSLTVEAKLRWNDEEHGSHSPYQEKIEGYECKSDDENVATVKSNGDGTFTIQAIAPGVTTVYFDTVTEREVKVGDYSQRWQHELTITVIDPNA
jgi:hypothetical protein